jgi:HEAT repeat protein
VKQIFVSSGLIAGSCLLVTGISTAHGGNYRGPWDRVLQGAFTGGCGLSPQKGPPHVAYDLTTWELWWGFNKEQYLNRASSVWPVQIDDPLSGLGSRATKAKPSESTVRARIVPALVGALQKECSPDIVTSAMIALAKIGDDSNIPGASTFEPVLRRFLADENQEIAETAAISLGLLANDASVRTLASLALDDEAGHTLVGAARVSNRTRAFATYGLGLLGARTGRNDVRQAIARILIDILRPGFTSSRDLQIAAVIALGLTPIDVDPSEKPEVALDKAASRQAQLEFLQRFYQDQKNHYMVRAHVPAAMARLLAGAPADRKDGVAQLILEAVADRYSREKDEVRQSCVLALGMIGDSDMDKVDADIRAALGLMTEWGDIQGKHFALIALAQIGARAGTGSGNLEGRQEIRAFLLEQLTKGRGHMRPWAGLAIGVMESELSDMGELQDPGSREALANLRNALVEEPIPERVGAYAIGVGIAGDVEAGTSLVRKLKETWSPATRGYIATSLGLLGARESIQDIQATAVELKYGPDFMPSAVLGVGLLGDEHLIPYLIRLLSDAKGMSTQGAIASALGLISDSRAIDPLISILQAEQGQTDRARGLAAAALGLLADKEVQPWNTKIAANMNYRAESAMLTDGNLTGLLNIL